MAPRKSKKRDGNAAKSVPEANALNNKAPKLLKPEPKIGKKSVNKNPEKLREANVTSEVETRKEDQQKTSKGKQETLSNERDVGKKTDASHGNKEKKTSEEKHEEETGEKTDTCHGNKEKTSKEQHEQGKMGQKDAKSTGGLILFCNAKTKPDCFKYQVMGVPSSKEEVVMNIKPGLKLFLYDYDLNLLYGIYEASSAGGKKLEPAAFGGSFPVQVRFKVYKDCLPLPESEFKKAMRESYDEKKRKFKPELTIQQVKKLSLLFRPASWLLSNAHSSVPVSQPTTAIHLPPGASIQGGEPSRERFYKEHRASGRSRECLVASDFSGKEVHNHTVSPREMAPADSLFLTEKEYRSYGLQRGRHIATASAAPIGSLLDADRSSYGLHWGRQVSMAAKDPMRSPSDINRIDREEPIRMNPASISGDADIIGNGAARPGPLFLSEKEYRTYGLRRELPPAVTPAMEPRSASLDNYPNNSYYSNFCDDDLVNKYLQRPTTVAAASEPYLLAAQAAYYNEIDARNSTGRLVSDATDRSYLAETFYPTYGLRDQPDHHQKYLHRGEPPEAPMSVSSRYSFAGPTRLYR